MLKFREFHGSGLKKERWGYSHETEIDGHNVSVEYSRFSHKPNHYTVDFSVNDNMTRGEVHPETAKRISHFVQNSVHGFIKHANPHAISMTAFDEDWDTQTRKQKVYRSYANKIAKKFGGQVKHDSSSSHIYLKSNA